MTRVWTIQPWEVWETVQREGVARVDPLRQTSRGEIYDQYSWLIVQLEARRGWTAGRLPWWAYGAKPDLRRHRHVWRVDRAQVRLEVEIPAERVFVMPCWAWDTVFGHQYLAFSEEEHRDWQARMLASVPLEADSSEDDPDPIWPLPEPWRGELHASWERLFDPDLPQAAWKDPADVRREAVFEEIRREEVHKVTAFTAAEWPSRFFRPAMTQRTEGILEDGIGDDQDVGGRIVPWR